MGTNNIVSIEIPEEVLTQVKSKENEIAELLKPFLIALTPEQRKVLPKMSDKTVAFVEKVISYAEEAPEFNPPFLNLEELKKDFSATRQLTPVKNALERTYDDISDTVMLSGSEAYTAALIYYNSVKHAAKMGVPGAEAVYNDLKQRFSGTKHPKE
jgi:hypothetical protein